MKQVLESDTGFYVTIGLFLVVVFVVGIGILTATSPYGIGSTELLGLVGGFVLFMVVYFLSITVHWLETDDQ